MRAEHYLATTGKALVDVRGRSTNNEGGGRSGTTIKHRRQPWDSASLGCRKPGTRVGETRESAEMTKRVPSVVRVGVWKLDRKGALR